MDAVLMCGGAGERLNATVEKPLFPIGGKPMIDRVICALHTSCIAEIIAVTSPSVPKTSAYLREEHNISIREESGEGYVEDLTSVLDTLSDPVVTITTDLPLISDSIIDRLVSTYSAGSITICVPVALKRQLDLSVDIMFHDEEDEQKLTPSGLNIVGGPPDIIDVWYDVRVGVNVNRPGDVLVAEALV